ncbi:2,3-dihydroxybiphenyl 1,2-dioxygenase [Bradyrhizobium sp. 45]|uniref:DODA-type extradiol aromatic ring-opening family dioxygenase n=1 Tax=Bradyrhizobium sp. 45 TaxID=1043587 RepID=UPI001FFC25A4|nr:2,3-dihydroxybiphenyl 1,2-dioxygenase [Bradyrhizobium sp. 45]MCK1305792.1 2,3-dihydroxybiphenyl 1,2-dioxygenase [Bradyrhizobium sp. 45]
MARLVYVTIIPHDPTLPRNVEAADDGHPVFRIIRTDYERIRAGLAAARPDVIVMASGDHFNQWFYSNIPTFAVGKGTKSSGPFPWERDVYGIGSYETAGDHDLGRHLLERGLEHHFDLAASDVYNIDHGFTVPLNFVRPEQDVPVVPLWTNVLIPPLPPGQRYYDLGVMLRSIIEEYPKDLRVAVIATGHMTNSVGGPAMLHMTEEPVTEWDLRTWDLFTNGRVKDLLSDCTWNKLYEQGNGTPGFMVHLVAWGVTGGKVPNWSDLTSSPVTFPNPFIEWNEQCLNEGARN